jgi:hypothetical protein
VIAVVVVIIDKGGELRIGVPIGYTWHRELGSARQVLLSMLAEGVHFPRPSDGKKLVAFDWTPIRYRNVISVLKNPFHAGADARGKGEKRIAIVEGRALFEIERAINSESAERRRAVRQELSAPLVADLERWLRMSGPSCRVATISPGPSITCSSAGRPSFSMTGASACQTMPRSEPGAN